jgi:hypothetical protein
MNLNYLETYHYRKYKDYCSNKCINIVIEQKDKKDKIELRGLYKGYLYSMKLFNALLQKNKPVRKYEIYNHFKYYKSNYTTLIGEKKAILDIMNLLAND